MISQRDPPVSAFQVLGLNRYWYDWHVLKAILEAWLRGSDFILSFKQGGDVMYSLHLFRALMYSICMGPAYVSDVSPLHPENSELLI